MAIIDESTKIIDFQESNDIELLNEEELNKSYPQTNSLTDDLVKIYLREIGKMSVLKHDAELELARKVKKGSLKAHA